MDKYKDLYSTRYFLEIIEDAFTQKTNSRTAEVDLFVPLECFNLFSLYARSAGFLEIRRRPLKRFHRHFLLWADSGKNIILDVQLGPRFELSSIFHFKMKDKFYLKLIQENPQRVGVYNASTLTAILYAANCVWLKGQRLEARNLEKLNEMIESIPVIEGDFENAVLKKISERPNDLSLDAVRLRIEKLIRPFFTKRVNPLGEMMRTPPFLHRPRSAAVIFLGPDGAGKSSVISKLCESLPIKLTRAYLGIGEEGWKLRFVKKFRDLSVGNRLYSILFWAYLLPIELLIRWALLAKRTGGRLFLIDRVPGYPLLRRGVIHYLYKAFIPKADIIVLLYGDPEEIARRKPTETSCERVSRELLKWRKVAESLNPRRIVEVDTTKLDLDSCARKAADEIKKDFFIQNKLMY